MTVQLGLAGLPRQLFACTRSRLTTFGLADERVTPEVA